MINSILLMSGIQQEILLFHPNGNEDIVYFIKWLNEGVIVVALPEFPMIPILYLVQDFMYGEIIDCKFCKN